ANSPAVAAAAAVGTVKKTAPDGPQAAKVTSSTQAGKNGPAVSLTQDAQATPGGQAQAAHGAQPQAPGAQPMTVQPQAGPQTDANQKAADEKSVAAARGEKTADAPRFALTDATAHAAANGQTASASSGTNAAQNLGIPNPAGQTATQASSGTQAAAQTATPPQTPAAPPVPLPGLAVAIAARASSLGNNFSIRLDPPELGRVDVRLSVDKDGHLTSHLMADRHDTLALLQRDSSGLQRALQDAGFKTAENGLQFSLRDSFAGQQQQQQQQQQTSGGNAGHIVLNDDSATVTAIPSGYGRYLGRAGGIDIRV
ncbi:MAG TPA: flagellar hook-length control protein FliK, partial [Pseudolabrys sp.]|nr:flagellar hook-length control protein FliK [Pseudolabrys sp.]